MTALWLRCYTLRRAVPLRPNACGLPLPLSVMLTLAARLPAAVGVNVTLMLHAPFAASVAGLTGHVFVCAKSPGFAPVMAMLVILSVPGPLFVTVTLCAPLVVLVV